MTAISGAGGSAYSALSRNVRLEPPETSSARRMAAFEALEWGSEGKNLFHLICSPLEDFPSIEEDRGRDDPVDVEQVSADRYERWSPSVCLPKRLKDIETYEPSEHDDIEGLVELTRHREIQANYAQASEMIYFAEEPRKNELKEAFLRKIQDDIDALEDPRSPSVVHEQNGDRSITVPLLVGSPGEEHAIAIKITKKTDASKGYTISYCNPNLRSIFREDIAKHPDRFRDFSELIHLFTGLSKAAITDHGFLLSLASPGETSRELFELSLQDALLTRGGVLEKSEIGGFLELFHGRVNDAVWEAFARESRVFREQSYGTCCDSSRFLSEWGMVSKLTRLRLQKHAIERSFENIAFSGEEISPELLALAEQKVSGIDLQIDEEVVRLERA